MLSHASQRSRALVLLGHGSHYNKDSSTPTRSQADALRRRGLFDEVLAAFWKEQPYLCYALDLVESDDVFVIPYFISKGYFTEQILPRELEIQGPLTIRENRRIFYGEPVGTHPSMTRALRHCAEAIIIPSDQPQPDPKKTTLMIVGHGTTQNENSAEAILRQIELLKQEQHFKEVLPAFIEQEPYIRDVLTHVQTPYAIIIPFFISDGLHSREDIPINMGFAQRSIPWKNPVHYKNSIWLWYAHAIGSEPWMTDVILDRVKDLVQFSYTAVGSELNHESRKLSHGAHLKQKRREETPTYWGCIKSQKNVGNGFTPFHLFWFKRCGINPHPTLLIQPHRWGGFINEIQTSKKVFFGELLIKSENDNAFSIRHFKDMNTQEDQLQELTQPESAHAISQTTAEGKYRPLRTATNLRRGWAFKTSSETDLILFVNLLYPGAVAHHTMAINKTLRIRSFEEVATRQTGLYRVIRELRNEQIQSVAEECCHHCVKQPLWPICKNQNQPVIQKKTALDSFFIPCPEPCSFVIDKARLMLTQTTETLTSS